MAVTFEFPDWEYHARDIALVAIAYQQNMFDLTKAQEYAIDEYLRSKGIYPKVNPDEPAGQGDRLIDGVRTEYKTISDVQNPDESTISAAISRRAMDSRSQAPNVVIDARTQFKMTKHAAIRGIQRAFGADNAVATMARQSPKIDSVRVIFIDSHGNAVDILAERS